MHWAASIGLKATPLLPEVVEAMLPYLQRHFGNPSSSHVYGVHARKAVERAREQVALLPGCDAGEIVFTSGGTESNNLAIRGGIESGTARRGIVTSIIEHPATENPCARLEQRGHPVTRLDVDEHGRVRVDGADSAIDTQTLLVTVMHSNNETGVLQPVAEIAGLASAAGALVHTGAAQSVGKVPVRVRELDVDLLSVAGHKLYAPRGCWRAVCTFRHTAAAVHVRRRPGARHSPGHPKRGIDRRPGGGV